MKNFKLNKTKRFIILGLTILATFLTIILGSKFYVAKDSKKSIEYGGGAEYVVKVTPEKGVSSVSSTANQVAQEIYDRVNKLGISGASVNAETSGSESRIRVTYPGVATEEQRSEIENLITKKPVLTLTDIYGNPLFIGNGVNGSGIFNRELIGHSEHLRSSDALMEQETKTHVPISNNGAVSRVTNNGYEVLINLIPNKVSEWVAATTYISTLPKNQNMIVAWLNVKEFIEKAKYAKGGQNLYASAGNNIYLASKINGVNREKTLDTSSYLISEAKVDNVLTGSNFVIEGNFSSKEANILAQKINYGASHYSLKLEYSNYVGATYGTNAFQKATIAGMIVFALIGIFLIVNYGLLGALSTISISLYMFITLTLFTVMRGEYSPEAIAALIIGVGMATDANIITYERLKSEIYLGASIKKGFKDANKKSLSSIFDANITTLIVAFVLFFLGTRNIVGLSVTLILSIVLTLVVMLGFTRFTATLLVHTGIFENKRHLLGIKPKFDQGLQNKINKVDYIGKAKWFTYGSAFIFSLGLFVLTITAIMAGKFSGGFALSKDFTGGTVLEILPKSQSGIISATDLAELKNQLITFGIEPDKINEIINSGNVVGIKYESVNPLENVAQLKTDIESIGLGYEFHNSTTSTDVANKILRNAMIAVAVAIGGIIIYTLIRFKWTYSIAAVIALLHDAVIVVSIFVIARLEISPVFIAGLLAIIGYSINDTIVTFDRLRENMNEHLNVNLKDAEIKKIANISIKETLKRSLYTSLTTIIAVLVLMSFGNATKLAFNLAMLIGLVSGTYSSIFIATFIWTKLEIKRQKMIKSRANKKFWEFDEPEEQTFKGINDFRA
ncbi:MAG: protein translocase subunit SecDF [Mycoplasmatales bacterium]|nr:protein translocase subunit SecDF [Mycoplasmatales bacterium]